MKGIVPFLLLPLVLCACAGGVRRPAPGTQSAIVLMKNNIFPREGSFNACVWEKVRQGVPVGTAVDLCNDLAPAVDTAREVDVPDLLGADKVGIGTMNCGMVAIDPRAKGAGTASVADLARIQDQIFQIQMRIRYREWRQQHIPGAAKEEDLETKNAEDEDVLWYLHELLREMAEADRSEPGDYPEPTPGDDGYAAVAGEDMSDCERANEFIGECNRDGWRSPDCRAFLSKLSKCADPALIFTDPDAPAPCDMPGVGSKAPDSVKDIMLVRCSSKKRYGPDQNPCDPIGIVGTQYTYFLNPTDNPAQPCGNPYTRTTGEDSCTPSFTLTVFGEIDIQNLAREGLKTLGGPIFFVPVPKGTDVPGPKPRPTEGSESDEEGVHGAPW